MENTVTEEQLDRMITKAEKLKSILMECENFIESVDAGEIPQGMELKTASRVVFSVNVGNIEQILKSPAHMFNPEFLGQVERILPEIFAPRPVDAPTPNIVLPIAQA